MTIFGYRSTHTAVEFPHLTLIHIKLLITQAFVAEVTCRIFTDPRALLTLVTKDRTLIRLELQLLVRNARYTRRTRFTFLTRGHFYL